MRADWCVTRHSRVKGSAFNNLGGRIVFKFGFGALLGATLLIAGPASANTYSLDFTDTHGDTAKLTLTAGPLSLAGTTVTSITGLFNGAPVSEVVVFGADQKIYSASVPFVDYPG